LRGDIVNRKEVKKVQIRVSIILTKGEKM